MLVNKTSLANSSKDIIYSSNGIYCMYCYGLYFFMVWLFCFNHNSTGWQREVWIHINVRGHDKAQECNDGKFFLEIISLQEALNVFPPQNSNQPPDVILKWVACLCMSLTASFLITALYDTRLYKKEFAVTPPLQFPKKLPLKPSMPTRNLSIGKAKEFASIVFKEAKRIINYIQWLHFCLLIFIHS